MVRTISLASLVLLFTLAAPGASAQKGRRSAPPAAAPSSATTPSSAPVAAATPGPSTAASDVARDAGRKLDAFLTSEARVALDPIASQAASNVDVAVALGRLLEQERKYDESASVLRKAADAAPSDPRTPLWLGETLLRARKTADADVSFRKAADLAAAAVAARPDDAGALLVRGTALSRLRQYDDAIAALEKARALNGGTAETLYQMGSTRAFQQRWSDAVGLLTEAVGKESGFALAYYYRGLAQEKLGRKDLMILDMDRFVKLAPGAPEADRARALLAAATR